MEPVIAALVVIVTAGLLGWTLHNFIDQLLSGDD
jgi:hypothetical protein